MPAAAISVHPADAVDGKFFDLDFLQDAGLFGACFGYDFFSFHSFSPLPFLLHRITMRRLISCIATPMPKNKTLI